MSQSYNGWVSDANKHHRHAETRPPPVRLPPPDSLVAGVRVVPETSHIDHRFPPRIETPQEFDTGPSAFIHHHALIPTPAHHGSQGPNTSVEQVYESMPPAPFLNSFQSRDPSSLFIGSDARLREPHREHHHRLTHPQTLQHHHILPDATTRHTQSTTWAHAPPRISAMDSSSPEPTPPSPAESLEPIPNLLGPSRVDAVADLEFQLVVRQQPMAARSCGFGERDRRVIDPPPIIELVINSPLLSEDEKRQYLRYESYVMNCSVLDESGTGDASYIPEFRHHRRLMGSLVATPFVGKDDNNKEGCFFCFSDLSCRTAGSFRLNFNLVMIDPSRAAVVRHFPIVNRVTTDVFHVYNAKDFPGMQPSSRLAKKLREQGCMISIKKGSDRSKAAKDDGDKSDGDGDEDGGDSALAGQT